MAKSLDTLIKNVRELADEYPDYVYRADCTYISGGPGNQGCIVGQASVAKMITNPDAGVPRDMNKNTFDSIVGHYPEEFTDVTEEKVDWLSKVQELQDNEEPWGQAVEKADSEFDIDV